MTEENTVKRPESITFKGRILFLTEDTSLIRQQLEAEGDERELRRRGIGARVW